MSKKRKLTEQSVQRERNRVALNPLLRKSQVHQKSNKAKRQANKLTLKKTWFERAAALAAVGQSHVFKNALAMARLYRASV